MEIFLKSNLLFDGFKINKLNLNSNKIELMQFTIRNQDYTLSILLKGNKLESIEDLQLHELFWTLYVNFQSHI